MDTLALRVRVLGVAHEEADHALLIDGDAVVERRGAGDGWETVWGPGPFAQARAWRREQLAAG